MPSWDMIEPLAAPLAAVQRLIEQLDEAWS